MFKIGRPLTMRVLKTTQLVELDVLLIMKIRIVTARYEPGNIALDTRNNLGNAFPRNRLGNAEVGDNEQQLIVALMVLHPPAFGHHHSQAAVAVHYPRYVALAVFHLTAFPAPRCVPAPARAAQTDRRW